MIKKILLTLNASVKLFDYCLFLILPGMEIDVFEAGKALIDNDTEAAKFMM